MLATPEPSSIKNSISAIELHNNDFIVHPGRIKIMMINILLKYLIQIHGRVSCRPSTVMNSLNDATTKEAITVNTKSLVTKAVKATAAIVATVEAVASKMTTTTKKATTTKATTIVVTSSKATSASTTKATTGSTTKKSMASTTKKTTLSTKKASTVPVTTTKLTTAKTTVTTKMRRAAKSTSVSVVGSDDVTQNLLSVSGENTELNTLYAKAVTGKTKETSIEAVMPGKAVSHDSGVKCRRGNVFIDNNNETGTGDV